MTELEKNIFMFGCWNRDNCGGPDYRQHVLDMVHKDLPNYDMGIILGDNIYPHKSNTKDGMKTKLFKSQTLNKLNELIEKCIPITKKTIQTGDWRKVIKKPVTVFKKTSRTIPVPDTKDDSFLKVILGNHDEEDNPCIKQKEINILEKAKNVQLLQTNTITECELCYYIYLNTNTPNRQFLTDFLNDILKGNTKVTDMKKWLLFIGHEPLFSFKYKDKTGVKSYYQSIDKDNSIIRLFELIYKKYPKMVYLCADTHNFQILEVSNTITNSVSSRPSNVSRRLSKLPTFRQSAFNNRSFRRSSVKRPSASVRRPSASVKRPSFKRPSASASAFASFKRRSYKKSYPKQFKIPIIICGTGGAKLDTLDEDDPDKLYNKSQETGDNTYTLNLKIGIKQYGYCSLKITPDKIEVVFNSYADKNNYKISYNSKTNQYNINESRPPPQAHNPPQANNPRIKSNIIKSPLDCSKYTPICGE